MAAETSYVDVQGKKTQVTRGGEGPPLVYLHSALGETDWLPVHDGLAGGFEVVVPAHPGFSDSEGYEAIRDIEDLAFHYDDLFAELSLDRPALVGQSLGGWIAAEYAVRWPERISALVLIDAVGLRVEGAPVPDMWMVRPPELADMIFASSEHPLYQMMKAFDPEHPPPAEILVPFFEAQRATARVGWNPYLHNPKLEGRLHRVTTPTLVLWGDADGFVPAAHGERYAERIAGARLERIADAGHLPAIERPEAVAEAVRGFLEG